MRGGLVRIERLAVAPVMASPRFVSRERAFHNEPGDDEHVLRFPRFDRRELLIEEHLRPIPNILKRLFELEVPEISDGKIEIKKVAREAGVRSKVAVYSNDPNLEPVGCCIGNRGIRINSVVSQLAGEKIDVIRYSDDPKEFVSQALLPAKVLEVEILDEPNLEKVAFVSVPEDQISLAIGNHGLNAKLAAMITGFKIDINPQSGFYGEDSSPSLKQKLQARLQQQLEKQNQCWLVEKFFAKNSDKL